MHAKALLPFVLPCLLLASACNDNGTSAQTVTSLSGRVVAGPVAGADVTVLPLLNTGALGAPVGAGTTDSQGYYSLDALGIGPVVIVARGGEYVDEATGITTVADNLELMSLVVLAGQGEQTAHVTVATTFAARRAMVLATEPTLDALAALENGIAMVEEYYGVEDIVTTLPADLTAGTVVPGPAADYGALNAGFSQLADDRGVYLWSLVSELAKDGSDGAFDGKFVGGPLYLEGPAGGGDLFIETGGADLQQSIGVFVLEAQNESGLTIDDLSIDESIDRHVREDPDFAVCVYQPRIDVVDPPLGIVNEATEVTLRGQFPDLDGVSLVVTFGGEVATVVKGDDEELQVLTPMIAFPGKVDVEVKCESTSVHGIALKAFEYYVPYLDPVITGVTPGKGPEVGGTLIEVTGQNFDPRAIVEVGGTQASTIARLGRTVLVVVAPPGTGTKNVAVKQADITGAPQAILADAFTYFGKGTGDEPTEAQVEGQWKAYAISHMQPDTVMVVNTDLTLAGGTFAQNADMWIASPDDPEGTSETVQQDGLCRVFADGTLWLHDLEQPTANRAFLSPERDVFVLANDTDTNGPVWLGAGIRRASGMSTGSLTGTWYLGLFTHGYEMGADVRRISSAHGTAEFDGHGHGSAGLIGAECRASGDWDERRDTLGGAFTYQVASDGTFTITITPEQEGDAVVFHGSLTEARDLGVAVSTSGGQAQFLMMVPCPEGLTPAYANGSWYGGGLAYEYEPYDGGHYFYGETIRVLADGHGKGLAEVSYRGTSYYEWYRGLGTDIYDDETLCETNGFLIGGPDDLSGFVGASRRFQINVPANLEVHPYAEAVQFMGAALLVRRPATYSTWTIDDGDYNAVGISTEYKEPGQPMSLEEENTSFLTHLGFTAATYDEEESDLVGQALENSGRVEKTVRRTSGGVLSVVQREDFPAFRGSYAVFGDGRILMTLEPSYPELSASEEDMFEEVVGEITGNADTIMLRNFANPDGASALIILARDGSPTINGVYNGGAVRFDYDTTVGEWAEAGIGSMDFDYSTVLATGTLQAEFPNGSTYRDGEFWSSSWWISGGLLGLPHPAGTLTGVVTPDGAAFFLVDLGENHRTTLLVGLKQPTSPVEFEGSYRLAGFDHRYVTQGPIPVEAKKEVIAGPWRMTTKHDAGFLNDIRKNNVVGVERRAYVFPGTNLAVNDHRNGTLITGYDTGWFAEGGKYGFLMTTDLVDETIYPGAVNLKILTR